MRESGQRTLARNAAAKAGKREQAQEHDAESGGECAERALDRLHRMDVAGDEQDHLRRVTPREERRDTESGHAGEEESRGRPGAKAPG